MTGTAVLLLSATVLAAGLSQIVKSAGGGSGRKPPRDDPRWNAPPGPPQVVGKSCALCRGRIVVDREGLACAACGTPVHASCVDLHRVRRHRPKSRAPYR